MVCGLKAVDNIKNMKQHITKKQWDELNQKEKEKIIKISFEGEYDIFADDPVFWSITIGWMIEFLGNSIDEILLCQDWKCVNFNTNKVSRAKKLCDALWEACKFKMLDKESSK